MVLLLQGLNKFALPYESAAFHEPLQGDRQVTYVLPDNCSIAEAKRIAYGEFLATSNAWDLQAEKIRLQRFKKSKL